MYFNILLISIMWLIGSYHGQCQYLWYSFEVEQKNQTRSRIDNRFL